MPPIFLRIALPTPLPRLFDYLPPQDIDLNTLIPGVRVSVPFQSRTLIGLLIEVVNETSVPYGKLKLAVAILDSAPLLPQDVYELCTWAAAYYHYPLGEVLVGALPTLLRKGKEAVAKKSRKKIAPNLKPKDVAELNLNAAQQQAVTAICAAQNTFKIFLLNGVTGSGKTEVYLRAIAETLQLGKQVLVLVPEISLTPQTIEHFRKRFSQAMVALHSSLSDQERLNAWIAAKSNTAKIVIGTRSAIFTAFTDLGLIIVDEEHDNSFKQQDRFRYHARDLAIMRASIKQIPIVLGSATPSLESLYNVARNRFASLSLPERAGQAQLPTYQVIDLRNAKVTEGLSNHLLQAMREHLAKDNQVMLFLNRRGFAPVLYCVQCGWIANCKRCDSRLIYHRQPLRLQCHHCDAKSVIPTDCPQCQQKSLEPVGLGTQRLEEMLKGIFPDVPVIRVDRDNTRRKDAMENLLEQINEDKKAILIGTQMLAKGHHFPQVTLVGIVDADSGLFSADFRAAEQMGQLLLQVAGRAGRAEKPGTVIIQTRSPEHPLLQTLIEQGYPAFSEKILAEREKACMPPYSYFAVFRAEAYSEKNANDFLLQIKTACVQTTNDINVLGPVPAILAKRKGLFCQHLLIKSRKRNQLQKFLQQVLAKVQKFPNQTAVKWVLDVDPVEI